MLIFFEEKHYSREAIPLSIKDLFFEVGSGSLKTQHVGYYNNYKDNCFVILPKLFSTSFLNSGEENIPINIADLPKETQKFIINFITFFYQSLKVFLDKNKKSKESVSESSLALIKTNISNKVHTNLLEVILTLLKFHKQNEYIFIKSSINVKAKENSTTQWHKTIIKEIPILARGTPIYLNTINKRSNFQTDELLDIYYQLLLLLRDKFAFPVKIHGALSIKAPKNVNLFNKTSLRKLKKIKHRYFNDKLKELHTLLEKYFSIELQNSTNSQSTEYLFMHSYHILFEDMVDKIFSDENSQKLKKLRDGKIIDHIFSFNSIFKEDSIYYIGDSKYYQEDTVIRDISNYKQFTYAKNIIQDEINLYHSSGVSTHNYRDDLTEGYNITPNFFIKSYVTSTEIFNPKIDFKVINGIQNDSSCHFKNRAFDRDSFHLIAFKINFIFLLNQYILKKKVKSSLQKQLMNMIRTETINYYQDKYDFQVTSDIEDIEQFVNSHFKKLNGKIFRPTLPSYRNKLVIALNKSDEFRDENLNVSNIFNSNSIVLFPLNIS